MLYERWLCVARESATEIAVWDHALDRHWTFAQLAREADSLPAPSGPISFAEGVGWRFLTEVLRAWRAGAVLCPLEAGQPALQVPPPPSPCAHLKTTSATTGIPRLVAFTGSQLAADADNIVATMGLRRDWPNLAAISLAHSYGCSNLVLPLLLHGIPLILAPTALPESVRLAAAPFPAITLPAVPALWRAWLEAGAIPPQTRIAISAGAPLPAALEREVFQKTGLKIHNFYGSSECGGIAYDRTEQPRDADACVGTAMTGVQHSLTDDGCLVVHGAAVGQTYWPEPAPVLQSGRFQTSDLAELRPDGVYLKGRISDLINVAGRKLAPEGVEQALRTHPAVRECLVFGVPSPDGQRGEDVVASVVADASVTSEILRSHLLSRLPAWQVPRRWWFLNDLPANERGKLSRAAWRQRFLAAQVSSTSPAS